jgi:hypothetical protein
MIPIASRTRRAVLAAAALLAAAPDAAARRRKPKPKVFVSVAITGVAALGSGSERYFQWSWDAGWHWPEQNRGRDMGGGTTGTAVDATQEQARAQIAGGLRSFVFNELAQAVPADQIAVTIL